MLQLVPVRSTIVAFIIGLAALHLFLFNDLFEKIHLLRMDILDAIKDSAPPLPFETPSPVQVAPSVKVAPALPAQVTVSPKLVEDAEKWRNLISMTNVVPQEVKQWFTYSETESTRLSQLEGDHLDVIEYIKKNKLIPAPPAALLTKDPAQETSTGQAGMAMNLTRNKRNGFYVECGAFDGKSHSTTFMIERSLNWSGILIEAEPTNFHQAVQKRRNAVMVPACLSLSTKPKVSSFHVGRAMQGKIEEKSNQNGTVNVQCLPLYSILLATGKTTVDVFSLDIEGHELDVLKTIPFDKVDIKIFVIEHYNIQNGREVLEKYMTTKGYVTIQSTAAERVSPWWAHWDCIFVKKGSGYLETHP